MLGGSATSAASHVSEESIETDKALSRQRDADESDRNPGSFRLKRNEFFKSLKKLDSSPLASVGGGAGVPQPSGPRSQEYTRALAPATGEQDVAMHDTHVTALAGESSCTSEPRSGHMVVPPAGKGRREGEVLAGVGSTGAGLPADPNVVL